MGLAAVAALLVMGADERPVEPSTQQADPPAAGGRDAFLGWWTERRGPTGLVISNVGDPVVHGWAVLYDQMIVFDALRGRGMDDEALRLLEAVWDQYPAVDGLRVNAVHAATPGRITEWSTHVGPNAHLGRRCLEAHAVSGEAAWLERAVGVAEALRRRWLEAGAPRGIPHTGVSASGHEAASREVYGVEENLAALVFIESLPSPEDRRFDGVRRAIRALVAAAYEHSTGGFSTAFVGADPATFHASDVQGIVASALGVEGLERLSPGATVKLLNFFDREFAVTTSKGELAGFDFTNRRKGRGVVSPEWSAQVAEGWLAVASDARARGDARLADRLETRAGRVLLRLKRLLEGGHRNRYAYLADGRSASPRGTWRRETAAPAGESVIGLAYVDALCHGRRPIGRLPSRPPPSGAGPFIDPPLTRAVHSPSERATRE